MSAAHAFAGGKLARARCVPDCRPVRSWFVIPAMGVASGAAAVALGMTPMLALTGAAIAAVIRVLAGASPAALTGAVLAPLLAVASLADAGSLPTASLALAIAAAAWTVTELAREDGSPLVAVAPAALAGLLDPSFVALLAIAGARLVTSRGPRPRWALAVPLAGILAIVLAAIAGTLWHALGRRWFGGVARPISITSFAVIAATTLGPMTAVAALAGLGELVRARRAELALAAVIAGAILVDLRAGALGPATIGLAAVLAGLAIVRLATTIRLPAGQVISAATIGALVIVPPAWIAVAHRSAAPHIARASR